MKIKNNLKFGITANLNIIGKDGKKRRALSNVENLILDSGMIDIGSVSLSNFQQYCHKGDDGTGNSLDSGVITASQSGTTVTSSGAIFLSAQVGDLIKFDSGEEHYITSFTSSTEVEVNISATVASTEFTIWNVNRTALGSETALTATLNATSTWSESSGVITRTVTHIFPAQVAAENVAELGWGHENNANIGSRVALGAPVALAIGEQLEVESNFEMRQTPRVATAIDPTSDEGAFAGDVKIEGIGYGNLDTNMDDGLEPAKTWNSFIITDTAALNAYGTVYYVGALGAANIKAMAMNASPTSAPWIREGVSVYSTSEANITIGSLGISGVTQSGGFNYSGLRLLLTTPQAKANDQTLTLTFQCEWERNLTN